MGRFHRWLSTLAAMALVASLLLATGAPPASAATPPPRKLPPLDTLLKRVKTQVVVRFEPDTSAAEANAAVAATGGSVRKSLGELKLADYGADAAAPSDAARALRALNARPDVVYAFYNQRLRVPETRPAPPSWNPLRQNSGPLGRRQPTAAQGPSAQGAPGRVFAAAEVSLRPYQYHLDRIGADLAPTPDSAPAVAVIDSGVDYRHPDLAPNVLACPNLPGSHCDLIDFDQDPMDASGHGTHVAGAIAARTGVVGGSPTSKVLPVRIFDDAGWSDLFVIFQALDYTTRAKAAIPSLRVANMSWGGLVVAGSYEHQEFNSRIADMVRAGILPVAAAGNESSFLLQAVPMVFGEELADVPAMSPGALGVAATDYTDYRAFFSSYSTDIRINSCATTDEFGQCPARSTYRTKRLNLAPVAAPGWQTLSTTLRGQHAEFSGTSMASPIVAGAAARVMAQHPSATGGQVASRLRGTGHLLGMAQGFPVPTARIDLARALGVNQTGFIGRVVDGVSGQGLAGARVLLRDSANATVASATTNAAGFYTLAGATGGRGYKLVAYRWAISPRYIANERAATAVAGRLSDSGDLSLAPARNDGAYTFILDWRNVQTGLDEFVRRLEFLDSSGAQYPWPVNPANQPFAYMDAYFGAPFPGETTDSVEFHYDNRGTLASYPYGRFMHDSEYDFSPHEAIIIRQLPPVSSLRYGVKWFTLGGHTKPGATVSVYRNSSLVKRSALAAAAAPADGTQGDGATDFYEFSAWALYDIPSSGAINTPAGAGPNGRRTDYVTWIHRNNDVQGVRGPARGGSVSARLDATVDNSGVFVADIFDTYRVTLEAGQTHTFKLSGPSTAEFDLALFDPTTLSIQTGFPIVYDPVPGSNDGLSVRIPAGQGGEYYLVVAGWEGAGPYTLTRR
jgi:subtilisin family serine protease